jgi:hypothetical protein
MSSVKPLAAKRLLHFVMNASSHLVGLFLVAKISNISFATET